MRQNQGSSVEATDECDRARVEMRQTTKECDRTREELLETREQLDKATHELEKTNEECHRLKNQLRDSTEDGIRTRGDLLKSSQELNMLMNELGKTKDECDRDRVEWRKTYEERNTLRALVNLMQERYDTLSVKVQQLEEKASRSDTRQPNIMIQAAGPIGNPGYHVAEDQRLVAPDDMAGDRIPSFVDSTHRTSVCVDQDRLAHRLQTDNRWTDSYPTAARVCTSAYSQSTLSVRPTTPEYGQRIEDYISTNRWTNTSRVTRMRRTALRSGPEVSDEWQKSGLAAVALPSTPVRKRPNRPHWTLHPPIHGRTMSVMTATWAGSRSRPAVTKLNSEKTDWDAAQKNCQKMEANLVSIHTLPELGSSSGTSRKTWSSCGSASTTTNMQMDFQWTDHTPVIFTHWHPYEPNNFRNTLEDCVSVWGPVSHL
ncbi:hypothetical protein WMY93_017526 [Mugilogobius chulae]|uniref:C-type lectin domain-containing protein n=1 Tax=Mugilogobius chulae TaxID=88201 RepID=A0AAW0NSX2_9GOBI